MAKWLLSYGSVVFPEWAKRNYKTMELAPLDGIICPLVSSSAFPKELEWNYNAGLNLTGGADISTHSIMRIQEIPYERWVPAIETWRSISFTTLRRNFVSIQMNPGNGTGPGSDGIDWFVTSGMATAEKNLGVVARAAKDAGFLGLWLDLENYDNKLWKYSTRDAAYSFARHQTQCRYWGVRFACAIANNFPDCHIILPYSYRAAGAPVYTSSNDYGLLPSFLDGFYDALTPGITCITATPDGGNSEVFYTTPSNKRGISVTDEGGYDKEQAAQFQLIYNQCTQQPYIGTSPTYSKITKVGHTNWIDNPAGSFTFSSPFAGNPWTPTGWYNALVQMFNNGDDNAYYWLYAQTVRYTGYPTASALPTEYLAALRAARKTCGLTTI